MLGSELPSLSVIARTKDEQSGSEVRSEHSQSTEPAIAHSLTVIALKPSDIHMLSGPEEAKINCPGSKH